MFELLFGLVGVAVAGSLIAFACDELSEEEKRRQKRMRDDYAAYEDRKRREYQSDREYFDRAREESRREYERKMQAYREEMLRKRKTENRPAYETMRNLWRCQRDEKKALLEECRKIIAECKKSVETQQQSYMRFKSVKATLLSFQEVEYKLEAYLEYMERYCQRMDDTFESDGELTEPFAMTLPDNWPYEGKVLFLDKSDFQGYGYDFGEAGFFWMDKSDNALFDNNIESLPFMFYRAKSGKFYLSLSKGLLKNSIGSTLGLDMEVRKPLKNYIQLCFANNDYLRISISRKDMLHRNRRTPVGSNLHVFVKEYDFALKERIQVSEKLADGLFMERFENVALVQTKEEHDEFKQYLIDGKLLEKPDEWRVGPIMKNGVLTGLIMQLGNDYAI